MRKCKGRERESERDGERERRRRKERERRRKEREKRRRKESEREGERREEKRERKGLVWLRGGGGGQDKLRFMSEKSEGGTGLVGDPGKGERRLKSWKLCNNGSTSKQLFIEGQIKL